MTAIKILIAVVLILVMIISYGIGTEGEYTNTKLCLLGLVCGLAAATLIGQMLGA